MTKILVLDLDFTKILVANERPIFWPMITKILVANDHQNFGQ
jgi:hypothetical protein